jgi:hypothetical protein
MPHNLFTQGHIETEYTEKSAKITAKIIHPYNNMLYAISSNKGRSILEAFSLNKVLKQIGKKDYNTAFDKICLLHELAVFNL